jgi:hypothetical protein
VVAFVLIAGRFGSGDPLRLLVLGTLWFSAVPLLYVVAQRMVDAWQLAFISLCFVLYTAPPRWRVLAAVPLAAATLTKLLPALLLGYVGVRHWRAGLVGGAALLALLAVGHVVYGPLMGFGYPLAVLGSGASTVARWSTHFENNSVRGLLYKVAAGFRLEGDSAAYALADAWLPLLNGMAYVVCAGLGAYLLLAAWRGRRLQSPQRRGIELSLAVVTMLLVSPHTAQDYTVVMLPVLAVGLWLWVERQPVQWSRWLGIAAVVAAALVGVFVPMSLVSRVLPFDAMLVATGNAQHPLFTNQIGVGIGAYDFFGLPGLGLLLAWGVLARLEFLSLGALRPPGPPLGGGKTP